MTNFQFAINAVLPIFLLIFLGKLLEKLKIIDKEFSNKASNFGFKIALPFLLFKNISRANFSGIFQKEILYSVVFCVISVLIIFSLLLTFARKFLRDKSQVGAFVQGSFRSNYVIIGIPLIQNVLGNEAVVVASMVITFVLPLYNILAVIVLSLDKPEMKKNNFTNIALNIIKNPLIISVLVGVFFAYFKIDLPIFMDSIVDSVAGLAIPLALISIGVFFSVPRFFASLKLSAISGFIKIVLLPLVFTYLAYRFGFREEYLLAIYVLFASPTAISSHIMAKGMDCDHNLAANIIILTTSFSLITFFVGVLTLKNAMLI